MSRPSGLVALGPTAGTALDPAAVEAWLAQLGLEPLARVDREGVTSWDLVLDGRRRADLRITLILDPAFALLAWAHFAPQLGDSFRKSYRQLLRWNDEYPFLKFSLSEDERLVLAAEVAAASADADALGLALARILALSDRVLTRSRPWLRGGAWREALEEGEPSRGAALLDRYHDALGELDVAVPGEDDETDTPKRGGFRGLFARRKPAAPASAATPATPAAPAGAPTGAPR
jgi:putative sensory transduction regulator